jgi:tRNA modification GTPase
MRGIVRLTGPRAWELTARIFRPAPDPNSTFELQPAGFEAPKKNLEAVSSIGRIYLSCLRATLPADIHVSKAPRSYTGQDLVEIHTISSPPLLECLIGDFLKAGARAANPGEFTLRAFLRGKLDLPKVEAVLAVVQAGDRGELSLALQQLAGGISQPLHAVRDNLLSLLADLEAGLDFATEDISFIGASEVLNRIEAAARQVRSLLQQLSERVIVDRPFRVALTGLPNAGKSSLFNALLGSFAIVGAEPGTTRDYLAGRFEDEGIVVELVDTPGRQDAAGPIDLQAQGLGREQAERADLILVCLGASVGQGASTLESTQGLIPKLEVPNPRGCRFEAPISGPCLIVSTKCDLHEPPAGWLSTSAHNGMGIADLRKLLADRAREAMHSPVASTFSRSQANSERCLERLERAYDLVKSSKSEELTALEIRGALEELDEMLGIVYSDDLLDRIFSRFCIGK